MSHCVRWIAVGLVGMASAKGAVAQVAPVLDLGEAAQNLVFTPLTPCRIVDTRVAGGQLTPGFPRSFFVSGTAGFETQGGLAGGCGVPTSATAAMINFVAVDAAGPGNLRAFPYGQTQPLASVINYAAISGLALANGVGVRTCDHSLAACPFDLTVQANGSATHLIADVLGYFVGTGPVITGVTAGTGLSGGGSSGSVGLSVDSDVTQLRVSQSCAAGSSIRTINEDGTVVCQADTNSGGTVTSVTAGTGLTGGTITGAGTIGANFAGSGVATTIARSDHTHPPPAPVTRTKSISATACTGQGVPSGDVATLSCGAGGMVRVDGDPVFPCLVLGQPTRANYVCDLNLPVGSQITSIVAHGFDNHATGYLEAIAWRHNPVNFGPEFFSNFGLVWQTTGLAFSGGAASFPIFNAVTPHTVSDNYQYVIAFALRAPTVVGQAVQAYGFKVTYLGP